MAKMTRNLPSQFTQDPNKRARMLTAGLFGFVPLSGIGIEGANAGVRVLRPGMAYARLHPPTTPGLPPWLHGIGNRWTAFMGTHAYWPWHWGILASHPDWLLGGLGLGVVGGGLMAIVAARERYVNWGGPNAHGKGQYGSAHWRPSAELGQSNRWWQAPIPSAKAPRGKAAAVQARPASGLLVGANALKTPTAGWVLERDEHALIMAITRAGKTRRVILPSIGIIGMAAQDSIVITDPKGEIYEYTAEWLKSQGYQVVRFDLIDPKPGRSAQMNPMDPVSLAMAHGPAGWPLAAEAARDIAHLITFGGPSLVSTEPIWINGQMGLMTALILLVADQAPDGAKHLGSVLSALITLGENEGQALNVAVGKLPPGHPAKMAYGAVKLAKDKTLASFFTAVAAALNIFADPALIWVTEKTTVDVAALGQTDGRPTAVFLEIPHEKKTRYPIASLIVNQIFRDLTAVARQHPETRLPRKVSFLLDEFGNMPQFPDFDQFIMVSAGMGMRLVMVLQNLEQLKKHYQDTERTIRGNAGTWLFLRTSDLQSAEELAKISGQYTLQTESLQMPKVGWFSMANVGSSSEGQSLAGRDLVRPDEILRWPQDWVWHWQAGYAPAMLPLPDLSAWACFAPLTTRHPFTPWPADPTGPLQVWDGGSQKASKKGGESTVKPEIDPVPKLRKLFKHQRAPIDAEDMPDTDADE